MTPEDFVRAIVDGVFMSATSDVLAQVESPSGRRPPRAALELAQWYDALPESDRTRLAALVRLGVHAGMFGMFAVFDGVRRVDEEGGEFELAYVAQDGTRSVLNPPSGAEMLHDLFQGEVYDAVFGPAA